MIVLQVSPTFDELKFKFENFKKIEFWKSEIINFENNKLPYTTCIYNTINILKSLKNTESYWSKKWKKPRIDAKSSYDKLKKHRKLLIKEMKKKQESTQNQILSSFFLNES